MEYPYNEKQSRLHLLLDICYFVYEIEMCPHTYVINRPDRAKEFRTIRVISGELRRAVVGELLDEIMPIFMRLSKLDLSCSKTYAYHFFQRRIWQKQLFMII